MDALKQEIGYFYFHLLNRKDIGLFLFFPPVSGGGDSSEALEKLHPSGGAARAGKDAQKDMLWLSPADYTRHREIAKIYILHHSK